MKTVLTKVAKRLLPEAARRWLRARLGWRWLRGDHATWAVAVAAAERGSGGRRGTAGDDRGRGGGAEIERVLAAARAVRTGCGAWERDGEVFAEPAVHEPLLAALRRVAASEGGRLALVDFGGALGSTWWQHRAELAPLEVDWRVVELPALVAAGRREFAGGGLGFFETVDAATADGRPTAILFSGVLQYLENPWGALADAAKRRFRHVIVDRAGCLGGGAERDLLTVQHTPPEHGGGRMPCWLFARERLEAALGDEYERVSEWTEDFDRLDARATYRGMHFVR